MECHTNVAVTTENNQKQLETMLTTSTFGFTWDMNTGLLGKGSELVHDDAVSKMDREMHDASPVVAFQQCSVVLGWIFPLSRHSAMTEI